MLLCKFTVYYSVQFSCLMFNTFINAAVVAAAAVYSCFYPSNLESKSGATSFQFLAEVPVKFLT